MKPAWNNQLKQAEKLNNEELLRHALVSIRNHHTCHECFTCACVYELRVRPDKPEWIKNRLLIAI